MCRRAQFWNMCKCICMYTFSEQQIWQEQRNAVVAVIKGHKLHIFWKWQCVHVSLSSKDNIIWPWIPHNVRYFDQHGLYMFASLYVTVFMAFVCVCHSFYNRGNDYGISLTHWGRVTHICVSKLTIIGSDNGLSPDRHQAIIWTNDGVSLIGPLGTNFSEIVIKIHTFSFKKMHLKMSSEKRRPFCLGLNVLTNEQNSA